MMLYWCSIRWWIYNKSISSTLSQSTFLLEALTATASSPFSLLPESSPLFLPPMCSRSRHAACMPMAHGRKQSAQIAAGGWAPDSFRECRLDIITGSNRMLWWSDLSGGPEVRIILFKEKIGDIFFSYIVLIFVAKTCKDTQQNIY